MGPGVRVCRGRRDFSPTRRILRAVAEERPDLPQKHRPRRLAFQQYVIAALERNELRALDAGGQLLTFGKVDARVASPVQDQRRDVDLLEEMPNVDLAEYV